MCEYCTKFHEKPFNNEDCDSYFMLCWNYSSSKDRKKVWHILALAEGVGVHSGKINYCPMCGRKLNKQPPAMAKENKDESNKEACNN